MYFFLFFKQKTAYEMRISDWSSDVCSSDLRTPPRRDARGDAARGFFGHASRIVRARPRRRPFLLSEHGRREGRLSGRDAREDRGGHRAAWRTDPSCAERRGGGEARRALADRKSTRLNSSH